MEFSIISGIGNGKAARVDDEHRLFTLSNVIPHPQHHSMTHQNLYLIGFCATLTSTEQQNVGIFQNVDSGIDFEFYITQISGNQDVDIVPRFGDFYSSGGSIVTPRNLYLGSGNSLNQNRALVYQGVNLQLDTTSGYNWGPVIYTKARTPYSIEFDGGLIIPNNQSVSFAAIGPVGAKICILAMTSFHDAGTKL